MKHLQIPDMLAHVYASSQLACGLYISYLKLASAGPRSPQKPAQPQPRARQPSMPVVEPGNAPAATRGAAGGAAELAWVGEPSKEPPAGLSMRASQHRSFYGAIARVGSVNLTALACLIS